MAVTRAADLERLERQLAKLRKSAIKSDRAVRVARLERQIERSKRLRARELERTTKRLGTLTASFQNSAERIHARNDARAAGRLARRAAEQARRDARAARLRERIERMG